MVEHAACSSGETDGGYYYESVVTSPIVFCLQLGLLWITLRNDQFHAIYTLSKQSVILYVLMHLCCLNLIVADYLRYVVDPIYHFLPGTIFCDFFAFSARAMAVLTYTLYLYQILNRIVTSFSNSHLKISNITIRIFQFLVVVPVLLWIGAFSVQHDGICINQWNPKDTFRPILYCDWPWADELSYCLYVALAWIAGLNIVFGAMFGFKLSQLRVAGKSNERLNAHFEALILKNSILTITGSACTVLNYMLWIVTGMPCWLYLDGFINTMVIGGMFRFNDRHYHRICRPCVVLFSKSGLRPSNAELRVVSNKRHCLSADMQESMSTRLLLEES